MRVLKDQGSVYSDAGFGWPVEPGTRPAVIVVDFTLGFTDTRYPTAADMTVAVERTRQVVEAAHAGHIPVIFTSIAYHPAEIPALPWLKKATGMRALLHGSRLVEIDPRAGRGEQDLILFKTGASAFFATHLAALLTGQGIDTVVICGATTSGCVRATAVDAVQSGFKVLVPEDCVADRARAPHEANLYDIEQKYGDLTTADEVVGYFAQLPDARASSR